MEGIMTDDELKAMWEAYGKWMKRDLQEMKEREQKKQADIAAGRCWVCGRTYCYGEGE